MVAGLLFGLSPLDPLSLCLAAMLLLVVVALAGLHPALRATTVQPSTVLRD